MTNENTIKKIMQDLKTKDFVQFEVDGEMHSIFHSTEKGIKWIMHTIGFTLKYQTDRELKAGILNEGKVITYER